MSQSLQQPLSRCPQKRLAPTLKTDLFMSIFMQWPVWLQPSPDPKESGSNRLSIAVAPDPACCPFLPGRLPRLCPTLGQADTAIGELALGSSALLHMTSHKGAIHPRAFTWSPEGQAGCPTRQQGAGGVPYVTEMQNEPCPSHG